MRINTPQSSSFSSSDTGTPTSSVNLMDNPPTSSSLPATTMVPNPKAGQGVLKLPSTKRSARRKPAIACLFCRERKIACGAPPVGSADTTCKYVVPLWSYQGNWKTNIRNLASAHGARASANTPRCRDVVFISVVTTVGVTTGNPRTQIMCQLHSY